MRRWLVLEDTRMEALSACFGRCSDWVADHRDLHACCTLMNQGINKYCVFPPSVLIVAYLRRLIPFIRSVILLSPAFGFVVKPCT